MNTSTMSEQLLEAGSLLVAGMTSVFIFLSVLIVSVKLIAKFVEIFPEPDVATYSSAKRTAAASAGATSHAATAQRANTATHQQEVITAITHAVSAYRQGNQPPSK